MLIPVDAFGGAPILAANPGIFTKSASNLRQILDSLFAL